MKAIILIVSLILLTSLAATEHQISLENNVDRPGMNYKTYALSNADPQVCAIDCANDPNCRAFTYVKPGFRGENSDPECWLKDGVPDPVSSDYCISGVKAEAEPKPSTNPNPTPSSTSGIKLENNVDLPGMNYKSYPLPNADPQVCALDCANDPNCRAFTYVKPGFRGSNSQPECWLKNGIPNPVPSNYCISGVKGKAASEYEKVDWNNIPGLVLHLFHNVNQGDPHLMAIPSKTNLHFLHGGDLCGSEGEGYSWWMMGDKSEANATDWNRQLPSGLVLALIHSQNQYYDNISTFGYSASGYLPSGLPAGPQRFGVSDIGYIMKEDGGDLCSGPDVISVAGIGYYWYETHNFDFKNWDDAETYLPMGTILGLKHSRNQPDKTVTWRDQQYDPVKSFRDGAACPPTFIAKNGGDLGGSEGEGFYWYEKVTGPDFFMPSS